MISPLWLNGQRQYRVTSDMDKSLSNELEPRNKNQGVACHQRKSSVFDFKTLGQPMIFQGQVNLAYFGSLTWPGKVTSWPRTLIPGTIGFLSWQATRRFLFHGTSWSGSQLSKCCEFLYCILMEKEKVSLLMGFPKKSFFTWFYSYDQSAIEWNPGVNYWVRHAHQNIISTANI